MFSKFPSIENFHTVRKEAISTRFEPGTITYRPKIKLHGTNAGIYINMDGTVCAQKRSSLISLDNDNFGFAQWVEDRKDYWATVPFMSHFKPAELIVFGEWCGPGIQNNIALSQLKKKIFAVFAIQIDSYFLVNPEAIRETLFNYNANSYPDDIHVLPWYDEPFRMNMFTVKEKDLEQLQNDVLEIEKCDPWVKETFKVEGIGEGLVYYPVIVDNFKDNNSSSFINRDLFSRYAFKVKGEKHQVNKQKQTIQLAPEVVNKISEFADMFATEQRFQQGLQEVCNGEFDKKFLGPFIGWVAKDVSKECVAELEVSGLDWKPISKLLANKARMWYMGNIYK